MNLDVHPSLTQALDLLIGELHLAGERAVGGRRHRQLEEWDTAFTNALPTQIGAFATTTRGLDYRPGGDRRQAADPAIPDWHQS